MSTVGRNQPCPCGSGKRYKECHGAIGAGAAASAQAAADLSWIPEVMHASLRAQRSGRGREAADGYRRVLAAQPANFDANHMLALVEYEQGHADAALALLRHAIELRPEIQLARHNLQVLEAMPLIEQEIGREVLPRLEPRLHLPANLGDFAPPGATVHLVIADELDAEGRGALEALRQALAAARVELWVDAPPATSIDGARRIDVSTGAHPKGGSLLLFGTAVSPLHWLAAARPEKALLVVTRDDPCGAIDRIDQLASLAPEAPGLACVDAALAARLRLPGTAALPLPEAPVTVH